MIAVDVLLSIGSNQLRRYVHVRQQLVAIGTYMAVNHQGLLLLSGCNEH